MSTAAPETHDAPDFLPEHVSYEGALAAYRWNSHSPEERARWEQEQYVAHMVALWAELAPLAATDEERAALREEVERYRVGYLKHHARCMAAKSRTANPMVTGPARFPVERNRKAMDSEARRWEEFRAWRERAQASIRKRFAPADPARISADDPDAPEALAARIACLELRQERMKAANGVVRTKGLERVERVSRLVALGISPDEAAELVRPGRFMGWGYSAATLTNNLATIKRLRSRLASLERNRATPALEMEFDGGRLVESVEDNRVRIIFDGKPDAATRDALKARGFRWAPSVGAWQRQRTPAAREEARRILGLAA